ncbi:oxygen-dependent tRNA uridine(34) hydroxylase TrhO [Legionella jordanis]|uniref:tRNA uridine(34) hydroxylase n=1 Tax=Legionella jordanis TaxID=456 RepID=A0A0W0VDG7_9GAMM|nr:rhodanese-related sulfurtransferase [Legionella jordanis]KTD17894.1 sulfur transferase [Legionella jordanis]RMX02407.1 rhodanese-related sulfurtransferase [Legionella jordanis]VEH14015.1 rhodanese domain protein [Legionella jordanis]HAT8713864.1 rhodanese-related sulfurtransferase [Legionella jordanis]
MNYVVAAFYEFTPFPDYTSMKEPILTFMKEKGIKGTIILASEGINGTICGEQENLTCFIEHLKQYPGLEQLSFKFSQSPFNPFDKSKVKLRKEIVTLGVDNVDPHQISGTHVEPEEWNQLISDPEVLVIDTRNDYEVKLGTFKGAINPKTENFRDFPDYVEKNLTQHKNKKIAMFCTGGIRCEKSTVYLKNLGFEEVYQLNGGILNYIEKMPKEKSLWEGTCFVFDNRVAVDDNLNGLEVGSIDLEWKNKNRKANTDQDL